MKPKKHKELSPKHIKMMQDAMALHQSGQLDAAEAQYKKLLSALPTHTFLLASLGRVAFQKGQYETAVKLFGRSLQIDPDQPATLCAQGAALQELKRYEESIVKFDLAIVLDSSCIDAYYNRGISQQELRLFDEAVSSFNSAIALNPNDADAYYNKSISLRKLKRFDEALKSINHCIALQPDYPDAYCNRGSILVDLKQYEEALVDHDHAIQLNPNYAEAYNHRGNTLKNLNKLDEALESYNRAIALKPNYVEAFNNRGFTLHSLKRFDLALMDFAHAIALKPDFAEAHCNQGYTLHSLKRFDEALVFHDKAISLKFDYAEAYYHRGNVLHVLKRLDEALQSYEKAIELKSEIDFILGNSLYIRLLLCRWDNLPSLITELTYKLNNEEKCVAPFPVLAMIDNPAIQRKTSQIFSNLLYPQNQLLPKINFYPNHTKLRIAYFSADFRDHPVSGLTAELYETHDRSHFEVYAFSFGSDTNDEMNLRIKAGVDHFYDVLAMSDKDVVLLARNLQIDIAIDLGGHTQDCRTGIFAMQVAPIQLSYIGYLGTMGADYYDYLIADKVIIPEHYQEHYCEKIVYLPSYQVNDSKRELPEIVFTRKDMGLPETGFVFCCFNNTYKLTPTTFDGWARILTQVEGSVLLLYIDNETAKNNLIKEIVHRGIDSSRLFFGKRLSMPEYLARFRVADLFLDTLPYNAGTTASDALRMGLPVLTCMGQSFASRVAASVLTALHLPELITNSQEEYEALAIELATHPEKLKAIKEKLVTNLPTAPLYDTPLFTRHLESAYQEMYLRYQKGLAPDHIVVKNQSPLRPH